MRFDHPWHNFLKARCTAIDWLYSGEGDPACKGNDSQVARVLSMDPVQAMLIRTRDRENDRPAARPDPSHLVTMARAAAIDLRRRNCPTAAHAVDELADEYDRLRHEKAEGTAK